MNRKQWFVLAWSCMIIVIIFIGIDTMNNHCFNAEMSKMSFEPADISDVWCVVNAEIYEPFIYLFYSLWIVFMICGFLEPTFKKKIVKEENDKFIMELAKYVLDKGIIDKGVDGNEEKIKKFSKYLREKYPFADVSSEHKKK